LLILNIKPMPTYNLEPIEESDLDLDRKFGSKSAEGFPAETEVQSEASENNRIGTEAVQEKETVQIREGALEKIRQNVSSFPSDDASTTVQQDTDALADMEEESRVDRLVNIALEKGPKYAFRVAMRLDDLYVLDTLHDTLVEKLYDELVRKGFIRLE